MTLNYGTRYLESRMQNGAFETWRDFFDFAAPQYDENSFTKNTLVEVQFIWEKLALEPGMSVLDMGCGTGRHAIALAERGAQVTGVDFSPQMLYEAKKKAKAAGVEVEWVEADGTNWNRPDTFHAAICICEGGLGLAGHNEDPVTHDLAILRNIGQSLRTEGKLLLTALNGYSQIRSMRDEDVQAGAFDPASMIAKYANTMELPGGPVSVHIRERLFIPPELTALLYASGMVTEHVWGGTAGEWGERPLRLDEIEMMFVARKKSL